MIGGMALVAVLVSTIGAQLFFKAYHLHQRRAYLLAAVALFAATVPCTLLAVRHFGIGRVYIASALSYVAAPAAAVYLFRETVNRGQILALALIVAGVVIYNVN